MRKSVSCLTVCVALLLSCGACLADGAKESGLTLAEAIGIAFQNEPGIREANIALEIARLELDAEVSKSLLPNLGLEVTSPTLNANGFSGEWAASLVGTLSLPLGTSSQFSGKLSTAWNATTNAWELGGWNLSYNQRFFLADLDAASGQLDKQRQAVSDAAEKLADEEASVITNVAQAYAQLLALGVSLSQAQSVLKEAEKNLSAVQASVNAGTEGESALVEAKIRLMDAQITVEEQEASFENTQSEFFRVTLGLSEVRPLLALELDVERLSAAATDLLSREDLVAPAVAASSTVRAGVDSLTAAQEELTATRMAILPDITIRAGLSDNGWSLGCTIAVDFFAPDRKEQIEMARLRVALAEEGLKSAKRQAENLILTAQSSLKSALRDQERLPLEEEKWTLEEQTMRKKLEAGTISEKAWDDFVEEKNAFSVDMMGRSTSFFVALLEYRNALGIELGWEEWLQ